MLHYLRDSLEKEEVMNATKTKSAVKCDACGHEAVAVNYRTTPDTETTGKFAECKVCVTLDNDLYFMVMDKKMTRKQAANAQDYR